MSEKRKVLRAAGLIGAITLLSRFTGLIRDALLAANFGGSRFSDVFLTAFEPTNMLRRIIGEGALSSFIVPLLAERRHEQGEAAGWHFYNIASNFLMIVSVILTVIGCYFSREVFLLFGGLGLLKNDPQNFIGLGTELTRLMFPYVIGLTLGSMMMGACHTLRAFGPPSMGSVMLNITMIAAGGAALLFKAPNERTAYWLAWSVLAGVILRVVIMLPTLRHAGLRWQPVMNLRDPHLRKLLWMMVPGLLAIGISQINISVSGSFAMFLGPGVKTYLRFSNQLIQFPMALTATAAATAMLPQLSLYLLEGRTDELRDLMALTKRLEIILMVPAIMGLLMLGLPIIELVYQRRAWNYQNSLGTYQALLFYAPSLLPLGWCRLLEPIFYARADRVTPLKAASISMAVNVALNWIFVRYTNMNQCGLALANTVAAFVNYYVLSWWIGRVLQNPVGTNSRIGETFWKCTVASAVACGLGAGAYWLMKVQFGIPTHTLGRAVFLFPVIGLIAGIYFALVHTLHVPDSAQAIEMVLRKFRKRPAVEKAPVSQEGGNGDQDS